MQDRFKFRVWRPKNIFIRSWQPKYIYFSLDMGEYAIGFEETDIVEQCTGLKDKKGNLIYEGDILKITDQGIDDIVKVYWENGMYCFSISSNSANLVFFDLSDNETTCEIIGNIHENADLLGEE